METRHPDWSDRYAEMVDRNIGLITAEQQEALRRSTVAVFGAGGIGGTAFEVLVRAGIGRFSIVDCDVFEATNLNRQVFAFRHTLGRRKIDVAAEFAAAINPDVKVARFDRVDEDNIGDILLGADAAVLGIDKVGPCIIASRACRERGIAMVEGWAIPYANVRVYTAQTPTLEEVYRLPTQKRKVADLSEQELSQLGLQVFDMLGRIEGVPTYYSKETVDLIRQGRLTSFAPTVWLTAVAMALEAVKVLLSWGQIALAPSWSLYDPFLHRIPQAPKAD